MQRLALAVLIAVGGGAFSQPSPAQRGTEARVRAGYEAGYRFCGSDSISAVIAAGKPWYRITAEYGPAARPNGQPPEELSPKEGCIDVLQHRPNRYDTAAVSAFRARQTDSLRAVRDSLMTIARKEARVRPFGGYTWVLWVDLVLGAILGAAALRFRYRDTSAAARNWWTIAGVVAGIGAAFALFLPLVFIAALFIFLSPPSDRSLLWMTTSGLVLVF